MTVRNYSSNAVATSLTGSASAGTATIAVAATNGFPGSTPYSLIIDRGNTAQEVVEVTGVSGLTLTVTRGVDGTTAASHTAGATVEHGVSARDFKEPNTHVNASTGVHGLLAGEAPIKSTHTHDGTSVGGSNVPFANVSGLAAHVHSGSAGDASNLPWANITGLSTHDHSGATGHGPNIPVANVTGATSSTHVHNGTDAPNIPFANVTGLAAHTHTGAGGDAATLPNSSVVAVNPFGTGALRLGSAVGNMKVQAGTAVQTTDVNGRTTIGFANAFPNGLLAIVVSNGDSNARPGYPTVDTVSSGVTLSGFKVKWFDAGGTNPSGALIRVDYIAYGF